MLTNVLPAFQFLYGTIRGPSCRIANPMQSKFQFLYGTIRGLIKEKGLLVSEIFQFLYGTIRGLLKFSFRDLLFEISIPVWYN